MYKQRWQIIIETSGLHVAILRTVHEWTKKTLRLYFEVILRRIIVITFSL